VMTAPQPAAGPENKLGDAQPGDHPAVLRHRGDRAPDAFDFGSLRRATQFARTDVETAGVRRC
jgi:hypothetical protein